MNGKDTKRPRGRRSIYGQTKSTDQVPRFHSLNSMNGNEISAIIEVDPEVSINLNSLCEDAEVFI